MSRHGGNQGGRPAASYGTEPDERALYEAAERARSRRIAKGLIRLANETPAWYADAACKGKTEMFFPSGAHVGARGMDHRYGPAIAICATCPVQEQCREQARRDAEFGVWGGESEYDRARLGIIPTAGSKRLYDLRNERAQ